MSELATPIALQTPANDQQVQPQKPNDEPELKIDLEPENDGSGQEENEDDGYEEIELDGKKGRVPKEWKELVPMGKDYRYKTGKLSEEQKAVQAERTKYTTALGSVQQMMRANEPPIPDIAMKDRTSDKYDPDQYDILMHNRTQWALKMQRVTAEQQRLEKEDADKAEKAHSESLTARQRAIHEDLPRWRDEATRAADEVEIKKFARNLPDHIRLSDDDIESMGRDPRLGYFVYHTMLYKRAVEKAKAAATGTPNNPEPEARPVSRVRGGSNAGNFNPYSKTHSTENYVKWRESQRRKQRS